MWFWLLLIACLGLSAPAWADGAIAVGCTSNGTIVWGYEFGYNSVEEAEPPALKRCQAMGSECTLLRLGLAGNGAWVALALDQTVPRPACSPWGHYYSASKETAAKNAVAACVKNGGHHCEITFLEQNKPTMTYRYVPGTGSGRQKDPRCFTPGPYGAGAVEREGGNCW